MADAMKPAGRVIKTIELCKLQLLLNIGVHSHERRGRQKLLVSLKVRVADGEEGDDINKTLDYDQIYHYLKDLEKADHFDLQETVCRQILNYVLKLPGVEHVTVSTKKTDIFDDAEYVGLTMSAENGL